ncbi:AMP-binding protein [bacterium]|nr:AMP-binding protein [bacterium]
MNLSDILTLIELLAFRAQSSPENPAVEFEGTILTYRKLWEGIQKFGAYLLSQGISPGERVLIALPNSLEFFFAFYGVQAAGGIAVPIFPNSGKQRILNFAKLSGASLLILPSTLSQQLLSTFQQEAKMHHLTVLTVSIALAEEIPNKSINFPEIQPDDIAFLQYTSGSTGNPKGVILTHRNLLTNVQQMIAGMEITANDIMVSWLPVYHDMGLILKTMVPFYLGMKTILLPTNLTDITPWVKAIEQHQATFTAAPDFAYRLCLRHLRPPEHNLKSLRVALNAAEPVRSSTLQEFEEGFGLSKVMVAGYGLAEATVGVSMWQPGTSNRVDKRGFVSVGKPFPEIIIKIMGGEKELPPGEIGEIAIKSTANAGGYFQNPIATAKTFLETGFILSGDLGYVDSDGYLYIVSRKKNIIKRAGETLAPQEIEELVDQIPGIRYSAALGIDRGGIEGEQVYIFAEIRNPELQTEHDLHQLIINIVARIYQHNGFRPARTFLLRPKTIPLTHNGKIQHQMLKSAYLNGTLKESGDILYPEY